MPELLFDGLMIAMPVTLIVVGVTLLQAKERHADAPGGRPLSVLAWVIISLVAFVIWLFLTFMLNVGHNQGATGIRGLLGTIVTYAGPALYIYIGYQQYQRWRPRLSPAEVENNDTE